MANTANTIPEFLDAPFSANRAEKPRDEESPAYVIDDSVRRAKAAQLAGRETVPVEIGSPPERQIPIVRLLSKKPNIELSTPDDKFRWEQIMKEYGPGGEPDLLPPIQARPGLEGIPIKDVTLGR